MKILVTGSAGFIGFHLSKELLKNGNTVIGIDNFNDYYDVNLKIERNKYLLNYAKELGVEFKIFKEDLIIMIHFTKFSNSKILIKLYI